MELHFQDIGEFLHQDRVLNADTHLHPAFGVAGQEVARGDVDPGVPPVAEAVNPGVLQIPAHNAADVQVLGLAGYPGPDAADAPDNHINSCAGAAGFLQFQDDVPVADGVVFQNHGSGAAQPGSLDDPVHLFQQDALEAEGRHQHLIRGLGQLLHRQVLEYVGGLLADALAGGDEGKVGVQLAGFLVVVAGADLSDIGVAVLVFAGDQGELGVDFVVLKTVNHRTARGFQLLGPVDVVLFVEPGPQLHQGHDLLAVFGGVHQGLDDLGLPGHPVEGHLDGNNLRVPGRPLEHIDKGPDGLVGVIEQYVVLLGLLGQVIALRRQHGPGRRIQQLSVAVVFDPAGELIEKAQIQRALLLKDPLMGQHQTVAEQMGDGGGRAGGHLEPDGRQFAAALEQLGHDLTIVDVVVHHALFDVDVGVSGDPEEALLYDGLLAENHPHKVEDQFLGQGKGHLVIFFYKAQTLHLAGKRDDAEALLPQPLIVQQHAQIDLLVAQEREGMAVVHDLGAQDGEQFTLEVFFPEMFLLLGELVEVDFGVAVGRQSL